MWAGSLGRVDGTVGCLEDGDGLERWLSEGGSEIAVTSSGS